MIARELSLSLPEPPTINTMLELARRMTRRGPGGAWMRTTQSVYWVRQQEYQLATRIALAGAIAHARAAGRTIAPRPWPRWRIVSAHYRVHQIRDALELSAGLKWPVDALVHAHLVVDDSPRELETPPAPTQEIARRNRGVTLVVAPILADGAPDAVPDPAEEGG